jgi:hypothetical protein
MIESYSQQVTYKEPLLLFRHNGNALENVSARAGELFQKNFAARGLAVGDTTNDGRVDAVVAVNGGPPVLARNNFQTANHWIGLKLVGRTCNRDAVGARIRWAAGGTVRSRMKTAGGSYLSYHDPREVLGLGTAEKLDWVEVQWPKPSSRVERFADLSMDRYVTLTEGDGRV